MVVGEVCSEVEKDGSWKETSQKVKPLSYCYCYYVILLV